MPNIILNSTIPDSFRVQQILGMFDLPEEAASRVELAVELPAAEERWTIGAIVGPSGSGKTSVARTAFGLPPPLPPWPDDRAVYDERSPINHTDQLATPLIIFQGLEDAIVPPSQADMMVDALRRKGVPFAYLPFEGEQHGFRQAANIRRVVEAELYFFGQMLRFEPADVIEPVLIERG